MGDDVVPSEKCETVRLEAHRDARELVRLIQCSQCSRPLRLPVTLPCGNSLCRQCLPAAHDREGISYPNTPDRRQAITCPFVECAGEHPASDCSVDVMLSKVIDSIAESVTRHASLVGGSRTTMEEVPRVHEVAGQDEFSEKTTKPSEPLRHTLPGGRLIATYQLAARGKLSYTTDLAFQSADETVAVEQAGDLSLLQDLTDSIKGEVDCEVCYSFMLDPVTTFCGHTLCRGCMIRVSDHSRHCPVCRRSLAVSHNVMRQPSNRTMCQLLGSLCPDTVADREEARTKEELGTESELSFPLFVCTLGYPHQLTVLRIFEPRYRLMLRRCLESNREFGMVLHNHYWEPQGELGPVFFHHYGTTLHIINVEAQPDGTSLVETRGTYRFRVTAYGTRDGYTVGNVERFEDVSLAEEERIEAEETALPPAEEGDQNGQIERMSTSDLLALGHEFIAKMQERSANWLQQRVLDAYGQPPDDAALFPYWFASVLPITDEEKYKLLPTRTVRERLKITATWIRRIEAQRWFRYLR